MSSTKSVRPSKPIDVRRTQQRLELYRSDGIQAIVKLDSGFNLRVAAYDFSPFGACIAVGKNEPVNFVEGNKLELVITLPDNVELKYLARVKWRALGSKEEKKYGLEFFEQLAPMSTSRPLDLGNFPVHLPEYFSLTGFFYKPYLFFERAHLKILAMSEFIWLVKIFDSEMVNYLGQKLEFCLLGIDSKPLIGEVIEIKKSGFGESVLQLKIQGIPEETLQWIGRQLIFVCDKTPVEIRRLGMDLSKVSNGLRFRFVKTQDEYERVLALRFKAYLEAGKVDQSKTAADMVAPLDKKSRILIAYHGEKVVASVAIAFPTDDNELLDTERAFANGYPVPVPPKTQVVEIARLCTDSDYRRTDLLNRVFEYTYKVTICGDRKYILTSTDNKLWQLYKKLGFKKTGMNYAHPYLSGIEHHIIIGERIQPDLAKGISPLAWNYLWRDMNSHMDVRGQISIGKIDFLRMSLIRLVGKIFRIKPNSRY